MFTPEEEIIAGQIMAAAFRDELTKLAWDPKKDYKRVNKAVTEGGGYTIGDVAGKNPREILEHYVNTKVQPRYRNAARKLVRVFPIAGPKAFATEQAGKARLARYTKMIDEVPIPNAIKQLALKKLKAGSVEESMKKLTPVFANKEMAGKIFSGSKKGMAEGLLGTGLFRVKNPKDIATRRALDAFGKVHELAERQMPPSQVGDAIRANKASRVAKALKLNYVRTGSHLGLPVLFKEDALLKAWKKGGSTAEKEVARAASAARQMTGESQLMQAARRGLSEDVRINRSMRKHLTHLALEKGIPYSGHPSRLGVLKGALKVFAKR